jgi:hypothetical protein
MILRPTPRPNRGTSSEGANSWSNASRDLHFADLAQAPRDPVDPDRLDDHLAAMAYNALTVNRSRHLAVAELFFEATRRPNLREAMSATRSAQIQLMRDIHLAAGIELDAHQAAMLVTAITGLVQIALTTPEAIGVHSPDDVRDLVHETVNQVRATPSKQ